MKKIYFLLTFILLTILTQAAPLLENEVTISAKNQPLEVVLDEISKQTGLNFSYNSSAVNAAQLVSIDVKNKSAEEVLQQLLGNKYEYKLTRKYIILKKSQIKIEPIQNTENQEIKTQIEDCDYIKNQVYVKKLCYSDSGTILSDCLIITNEQKNEVMKKKLAAIMLAIAASSAQAQTQDSTLTVKEQLTNAGKSFSTLLVEVAESTSQAIKIAADEIGKQAASIKVVENTESNNTAAQNTPKVESEKQPEKQETTAITSAEKTDSVRPFLFTIIYPFSFPELHPEKQIYNFSLNFLAGYNGGVEGCELGYIANVNRYSMKGFQGAGIANVSLGSVEGIQMAGTVNVANNSKDNVQLSGVVNVSLQGSSASQVAGVVNVGHTAQVQVAGVSNGALRSNVQIAGVANAAGQADVQLSGVVNASTGKNSTQISGVVNVADTSDLQLSLVNVARKTGTQIGLVNVADSVNGVMIGLVNVAHKGGLHQFEVSVGTSSINAAFRLGTKKFYTFYEASWDFENEAWRSGLGIGTQVDFQKNWGLNIEALHQNVLRDFFKSDSYNGLTQVRVVGYKQFAKHLSLFAGPSLYVYNTNSKGKKSIDLKIPYTIYSNHSNRVFTDIWVGATVGVRF